MPKYEWMNPAVYKIYGGVKPAPLRKKAPTNIDEMLRASETLVCFARNLQASAQKARNDRAQGRAYCTSDILRDARQLAEACKAFTEARDRYLKEKGAA